MITHPIAPVFDGCSEILILGSFPSVKSRETAFFYGHPQNRFWRVLSALFEEQTPETVEEKRAFLLRRRIAVWDVLAACDIEGSADSTISDAVPNDLTVILDAAPIRRIYVNGQTAKKYYDRFLKPRLGKEAYPLPSTSPANAAWSLARLTEAWRCILNE